MRRYFVLFRLVHVLLLLVIGLCGLGERMGIRHLGIRHWLLAFVCLAALMCVNFGRTRSRILAAVLVLVSGIALLIFVGVEQIGDFLTNYGSWLMGTLDWKIEWVIGYELLQVIIIVVSCYLLQMLLERYPLLMTLLTLVLLAGMIIGMIRRVEVGHIAVAGVIGYVLLNYIENTQRRWDKRSQGDVRAYVLWLMPFLLAYTLAFCFTPVYEEPYDWAFVKEAYNNLKERFTVWSQSITQEGQEDFETALAGFSEEGRLAGSLLENDKELLTIQGTQGLVTNLYLLGKVYDSFDGKQWSQTVYDEVPFGMDTLETLYAIERYDQDNVRDYVYSTGLNVRYEYFHTGYLFSPLKVTEIEDCEYRTEGGSLVFDEKRGYGSNYQLAYYQMNLDHEKFYTMVDKISAQTEVADQPDGHNEMLEQSTKEMAMQNGASEIDNEQLWNQVVSKYDVSEDEYTLAALEEYQQYNQEWYSGELSLSQEMEAYLQEIVAGADTTVEKLRAIEQALSAMEYTKKPGGLPDSVQSAEDFLDYFLLESKRGYCSHFATAFVLLARAEGIPARYVEGFCVPLSGNKKMTVTGNMAHAWPEVYLEGVGWIPFEPTPGYAEIRYTPWEIKEDSYNSQHAYEEDWEEEEAVIEDIEQDDALQELEELQSANNSLTWKILALMLLASASVLGLEQLWFQHRYRRMSIGQQYLFEIKKNLWLLGRLGLTRAEEETLQEFAKRTDEKLQQDLTIECSWQWIQSYEEYLYRRAEATEEDRCVVIRAREQLLFKLKNQKKVYYYYILVRMAFVR